MSVLWCACPHCDLIAEVRFEVHTSDDQGGVVSGYATLCAADHYVISPASMVTVYTDD